MSESERDHLDNLLKSPGWHLLLQRVRSEWGAKAYAMALERAATQTDAPHAIIKLSFANQAVHSIFSWPEERIKELDKQVEEASQPPNMSRGGAR